MTDDERWNLFEKPTARRSEVKNIQVMRPIQNENQSISDKLKSIVDLNKKKRKRTSKLYRLNSTGNG